MDTIRQAIYQTDVFTLVIEYELIDGDAIAISNVDIQARPVSDFQQRERSRRKRRAVQRLHSETGNPDTIPALKIALNASVWQIDT